MARSRSPELIAARIRAATSGELRELPGPPQYVHPSVSVRTRCGRASASSWATMPPIEMPNTCAASIASASSRPAASSASCGIVSGPSSRLLAPTPRWS